MTQSNPNSANADMPIYGSLGVTFMEFPVVQDLASSDAEVIVSGVPFDMATSGRAGARSGPSGVRAASVNMVWEGERWPWSFALDDHLKVADIGNVTFKHGEPQTLVNNLEANILNIVKAGKNPLTIGGDHFITLPILRSVAKEHGPVALIHFDAHTDTYSGGSKYDHGTFLHHAVEEGIVDTEHSIQIGIRTNFTREGYPFEVLDG
ncbi:MAG: arginase family protein, partial [Bermanella sp.]